MMLADPAGLPNMFSTCFLLSDTDFNRWLRESVYSAPIHTMNNPFHYHQNQLHCENLPLTTIAREAGTPTYVYSEAALLQRAQALREALAAIAPQGMVAFAVKANNNPHLLHLLRTAGLGADVSSGGELFLAQHAGFPAGHTIFSGVGKTAAEIQQALTAGVRGLHVESAGELEQVARIASERQQVAPVGVRVNPDVSAGGHAYIQTGRREDKFGLPPEEAIALLQRAAEHPWLRPISLHMHIGSQVTDLAPYRAAVERLLAVAGRLAESGVRLEYFDCGGGLGVDYGDGTGTAHAPTPAEWVQALTPPVVAAGYLPVLEPGRSVVAPAGALLLAVLYTKQQGSRHFVITDGGMNALLRPALYDAYHPIVPVQAAAGPTLAVDIAGPICESGDVLGRERPLPVQQPGDLLAVLQAGAYGYAMSTNYNGHPRPAEVLVSGHTWRIIRHREHYQDLLHGIGPLP